MIWIIVILGTLVLVVLWPILRWRKPKVPATAQKRIEQQWAHAQSVTDPHRKVMEGDKMLDAVLGEAGFTGSLGDKLKKAGKYLKNREEVWWAHKLRNRIAHEPGVIISDRDVERSMRAFEIAIRSFLR